MRLAGSPVSSGHSYARRMGKERILPQIIMTWTLTEADHLLSHKSSWFCEVLTEFLGVVVKKSSQDHVCGTVGAFSIWFWPFATFSESRERTRNYCKLETNMSGFWLLLHDKIKINLLWVLSVILKKKKIIHSFVIVHYN